MNFTSIFSKHANGDKTIWIVVFFLSICSMLAVYSSTGTLAYKEQQGNTFYYLLRHSSILLFGIALMYVSHKVKYVYFSRISQIALYVTIPLLAITLFSGTNLNEARRWLTLPGTSLTFQTSDFAKIALIMYVARILSINQDNINDFKSVFWQLTIPVLLVCGLIFPANFSTAAVLFTTCMFVMFIGRLSMNFLARIIGVAMLCGTLLIGVGMITGVMRVETWKNRIEDFADNKETSYQVEQAQIAVATGGLMGKGPGNSSQRNFLPHPYSDFIYAIIIEEYGLVGGIVVIILYLLLLGRAIRVVTRTDRTFGGLLAVGCAFSLVFQAFINMAVAVDLLPVTGQTLPLVSMGGTSLWFTSIAIGVILSTSRGIHAEKGEQHAAA
jgi:cell division protein FtsW